MYDFNFSWGIENKHWTKSGVFLFQKSGLKYSASQKNICNLIHSESKQLTWRRNLLEYGFSRNTSLNVKNEKAFSVLLNKYIFVRLATWIEKIILGPISAMKYFLEVSALLDVIHLPSCNLVQYQGNIMMQFWENGKSNNFGPNLRGPKFFYGFYLY